MCYVATQFDAGRRVVAAGNHTPTANICAVCYSVTVQHYFDRAIDNSSDLNIHREVIDLTCVGPDSLMFIIVILLASNFNDHKCSVIKELHTRLHTGNKG